MRWSLSLFLLFATPSLAWETVPGEVCTISHSEETAEVVVTYDLQRSEYAIAITVEPSWEPGPVFAMQFEGGATNFITTDRHQLSNDGATLTVTDSGFGNVLNGLAFNRTATALLGERAVVFSLDGAAEAVEAFRACTDSLQL